MPVRATKRGLERTPLSGSRDVLICGASFAGLAVARELRGSGARVLIVDRYEVGARPTSAYGIPTSWLEALGLMASCQQTFSELVVHMPHATARYALPWTLSTFDYRTLCALLQEQGDAEFEIAKVDGRTGNVVHTDRGDLTAPLIVDALGWRRILGAGENVQPPDAPLTRGLEVHPHGRSDELAVWVRTHVRAGYGWRFPADGELRIGVCAFDPPVHVKQPTLRLANDLDAEPVRFQGNWIPHALRPATEDGIFFAGDSAGHCLPLTAEGIRTALYFGLACGRELRAVIEGHQSREQALTRYHAFSASHRFAFDSLLRCQRLMPRLPVRLHELGMRAVTARRLTTWAFTRYLGIAHPSFASGHGGRRDARPDRGGRAWPARMRQAP
jgi:menaquinone-9 beta-reductase